MVACLDARVATNKHSLAVTHETCNGEITAQLQVLDLGTGNAVAFFYNDFGNFGIGQGQAAGVILVGVNQNLEDSA